MNSWWLKLYTIPQCKTTLKLFAIANVLAVIGLYLVPEKLAFIMMVYALPAFGFFGGIQYGLHANIDFHKMHIPLTKLRKIFIYDMLIQVSLYFFLFFLSLWIPVLFTNLKYWQLHPFILAIGTPSFTLYVMIGAFAFVYSIRSAKPLKMIVAAQKTDLKKKKVMQFLFALPLVLFVLMEDEPQIVNQSAGELNSWSILDYLLQYNFIFILTAGFLCMILAGIYTSSIFDFNIKRSGFKNYILVFGKSFGVAAVFCFLCGGLSYFEFNSDLYGRNDKMKTMVVFSDFMPQLEVETVKQLLPKSGMFTADVLRNAHPDFYEVPVADVIKTNDLRLVADYIYYGKPSKQNLIYLMREFESKPDAKEWKNDKYYKTVRKLLVYRAPEAKSLPDDLIHEKIETKNERAVASEKKGP